MANRIKIFAIICAVAAYPFLSALLLRKGWSGAALLLLVALSAWRAWRAGRLAMRLAQGALAVALLLGVVFAEALTTRLIPAFVYLSLAMLFGYTLAHPPCLIERMVRLQFPEFKPGISEYLRQITWLWVGFFLANVVICTLLAWFADERVWMLYAGLVVYILMAVLAVGEYLYRPRRFPDLDIPAPLDSIQVMMRNGHKVFQGLRE